MRYFERTVEAIEAMPVRAYMQFDLTIKIKSYNDNRIEYVLTSHAFERAARCESVCVLETSRYHQSSHCIHRNTSLIYVCRIECWYCRRRCDGSRCRCRNCSANNRFPLFRKKKKTNESTSIQTHKKTQQLALQRLERCSIERLSTHHATSHIVFFGTYILEF